MRRHIGVKIAESWLPIPISDYEGLDINTKKEVPDTRLSEQGHTWNLSESYFTLPNHIKVMKIFTGFER